MEEEGEQRKLGKHMPKRALRNKSLIISFDENDRREFVTGFHKRKNQRRKEAEKQQEKKQREKRLAERKKRRLAIKVASGEASELPQENLDTNSAGDLSEEEDDDEESAHVPLVNGTLTYDDGETTTIVKTSEIIPGKEDFDTTPLNNFQNAKSKIKTHIPARKEKSFKKVKKAKKPNKGKRFKKDTSKRPKKKGKNKQ